VNSDGCSVNGEQRSIQNALFDRRSPITGH
jgi:hypothetical protein